MERPLPSSRDIIEFLVSEGLCGSKSAGKRLVRQRAVEINGSTIGEAREELKAGIKYEIRVGKTRFLKVIFKA